MIEMLNLLRDTTEEQWGFFCFVLFCFYQAVILNEVAHLDRNLNFLILEVRLTKS